jgi:hypothetical protein
MSLLRRCLMEVRLRDGSFEDSDGLALRLAIDEPGRAVAVPCARPNGDAGDRDHAAMPESIEEAN